MAIKNVGLILFVLVFSSTLSAQKKALSKPSSVSIKPKIEPPILQVVDGSLRFSDANGNKAIDASELSHLEFSLKNSGFGDGLNLVAKLQSTGTTQGIRLDSKINLERVPKSGTTTYRIPIQSDMNTAQGKLSINVVVEEPNGFNPPPFSLDIETRAFQAPLVKVADFSLSGDGVLKPMSKFDLQILVQNTGQGVAKDVSLSFKLPENVLLLEGEEAQRISQLQPGETRSIKFGVIINAKYNLVTVPVSLSIRESFGKYAENWSQAFAMNQQMAAPRKLVVEAQAQEKINIEEASLKSDVDRNIPKTPKRNPNRLALVIGNEDYASRASGLSKAINVDYAENDAVIFAEYLKQRFGLDEGHIKLLRNATSGEMRSGLDWLANLTRATGPETELYFFYSGHGLPSDGDNLPYLIPVDISGDRPEMGIALKDVYQQLSMHTSSKITVVLDACFSGGARNEELVAKKGIRVRPKEGSIPDNMVVLTSSSGSQSSAVFQEKKHGFLTYFLLKGIQTQGVGASYADLFKYTTSEVDKETARQGKIQQPQILTPPNFEDWQTWTVQ
jgi:hypothetical protein